MHYIVKRHIGRRFISSCRASLATQRHEVTPKKTKRFVSLRRLVSKCQLLYLTVKIETTSVAVKNL